MCWVIKCYKIVIKKIVPFEAVWTKRGREKWVLRLGLKLIIMAMTSVSGFYAFKIKRSRFCDLCSVYALVVGDDYPSEGKKQTNKKSNLILALTEKLVETILEPRGFSVVVGQAHNPSLLSFWIIPLCLWAMTCIKQWKTVLEKLFL